MLFIRRVEGESMLPTYRPRTIVIGLRWWLRPREGRVVMASLHGREIIKRISEINAQGVYLLGDNPSRSTDSRLHGWFAPDAIKGIIIGSIHR